LSFYDHIHGDATAGELYTRCPSTIIYTVAQQRRRKQKNIQKRNKTT